jgi:hypothetical protein
MEWAMPERAEPRPILVIASLNFAVFGLVDGFGLAPISSTLYLSSTPLLAGPARSSARSGRPWSAGWRPAFLGDDLLDRLPGDRLDVGDVGHFRVGHDGGRVAVDQDDLVTLFAQGLAGLGAGVVELAGLADDDRASANDQNAFDVVRLGIFVFLHQRCEAVKQVADIVRPGDASGWPWKQKAGLSVRSTLAACRRTGDVGGAAVGGQRLVHRETVVLAGDHDLPVSRSCTGWLAPWWPNFIFKVLAPEARAMIWWPRQMPNTGSWLHELLARRWRSRRARVARAVGQEHAVRVQASTSAAVAGAGTTVTLQPRSASMRRMFA